MSRGDQKRMRRVIDALGGLQKLEEQRAARQLEQQQRAHRDLEEISELVNSESLTSALFGDLGSKYSAGLSDEIDALTEAVRQSSGEALRHGKRIETLSARCRVSRLHDQRDQDQRDLVDGLLSRQRGRQTGSGKLAGVKYR